ncbi:MAG: SDR family oxidoreductase [Cyclobacteriaceae bacterium]
MIKLEKKKMFDLVDKRVVVTGGASGIGKAISIQSAKNGGQVFIVDMDEKAGIQLMKEIKANSGNAQFIQCDITNEAEVENTFRQVGKTVDVLVNNAGIAHIGSLEATSNDDFQKIFDVNVKGAFNCMKESVKRMKAKGGTIINMSSVAATVGIADRFAYSMSKGAMYAMTMSVAKDYIKYGIRCNCISPGRVHTPFVDGFISKNYPGQEKEVFDKLSASQPIGRMGKPEEIAYLVLYLCSDEASFITGTNYPIDGGFVTLNN